MKNHITYYARGHTGKGFVNYWETNVKDIREVYVLKHPSLHKTSDMLEHIVSMYGWEDEIEVVMSPYHAELLEGIIIRDQSLAFMNDQYIDREVKTIDLMPNIEESLLDIIRSREVSIYAICEEAYTLFAESLRIHDDLEQLFLQEMDFQKANLAIDRTIHKLFGHAKKYDREAMVYERLFGTKTPDGTTDYVLQLIDPMKDRYFIKGRAGTGKSHFMKQIMEESLHHGYDVEIYRCSFDPESIDMIIIRALGVCLFDSTSPHEYNPSKEEDTIIDLYDIALTPNTDEKYADSIAEIEHAYLTKMREGVRKLKEIGPIRNEVEKHFLKHRNDQSDCTTLS